LGADLHILHVVEEVGDTVARAIGSEGYIPDSAGFRRRAEDAARDQLESSLTREDQRLLHARPVVRTSSTPALAIVWYAKEAGIDLIVMGTHGRKGLAHLVMGSVAERVVQTAPCPVLTVKRQGSEAPATKDCS
jgi:nucleotide-binding universal stress UspA family protein